MEGLTFLGHTWLLVVSQYCSDLFLLDRFNLFYTPSVAKFSYSNFSLLFSIASLSLPLLLRVSLNYLNCFVTVIYSPIFLSFFLKYIYLCFCFLLWFSQNSLIKCKCLTCCFYVFIFISYESTRVIVFT